MRVVEGGVDLTGGEEMPAWSQAKIIEHDWNLQCGSCGYGGEGWASSPALRDHPIIGYDTTRCPACLIEFTAIVSARRGGERPLGR